MILLTLFIMAVITRYRGYEGKQEYSGRSGDVTVYPMKPTAVKWTTSIGCGVLALSGYSTST